MFSKIRPNSKAKVTRLQKGLVTRYTHVKYSSAIAHCSEVIIKGYRANFKVKVKKNVRNHVKVTRNNPVTYTLIEWLIGKSFMPYRQYFIHVTAGDILRQLLMKSYQQGHSFKNTGQTPRSMSQDKIVGTQWKVLSLGIYMLHINQ